MLNVVLNPGRKREIPEKLYTRCWYPGSVCRNYENNFSNAVGIFRARKALCREYYDHDCIKNFTGTVIKTIFDYYYAITSGGYPSPKWFEEDFWQFWKEYRDVFESADRELIMYENDLSFHEAIHKGFVSIPSVSFWDWIDDITEKFEGRGNPKTFTRNHRIAVYHGTRNIYGDMYASLKSLVINSSVEKVYLLIEDDEFPYEVPDFVEIINVSDQKYILPSSPNHDCCWTWMVMLRAAFTKIFEQHDVILSLDTDTIIVKNIDELWDIDLTDAYYAAARELKSSAMYRMTYTNMGVCLLNLKKLREDGMDDKILHELNTVYHPFTEQDVFNELCEEKKIILPSDYNSCAYTLKSNNEKIIHFAGFREKNSPLIERYRLERWPSRVRLNHKKEES